MDMKNKMTELFSRQSRGQGQGIFGVFIAIGIGLVIVAVILGIGAYVQTEIYSSMPLPDKPNETAYVQHNITNATLAAMNTAGSWLNIFVIVAIAVAIIGLIFMFAGTTGGRGSTRGRGGRTRL